jgi:ATP-binding cassette subfamily B protein
MTDSTDGRPSEGALLSDNLRQAAQRRARSRNLKPLGRLWPFMRAHWGTAATALVFLLISTAGTLSLTWAARLVVNHGFARGGSTQAINHYFLILGGVAVVLAGATALRFYFVTQMGERVVADLRQALYAHILRLDQAFFLQLRTGEVLSRMTTDITIVENLVGTMASMALRNLLSTVGAVTVLAFVSPQLTGYVLLLVPAVIAPMFLFGRRVRKLSVNAQDRFAEAVGYAGETLDALDTIQAFGREGRASGRFNEAVETAYRTSRARFGARALMTFMVMGLCFGGIAVVLWLGAHAVVAGTMSGGALVQFVLLSVVAAGGVGILGEAWGEVQ